MIIFRKIWYRNFLATGDNGIEILLDKSPTTCVSGSNGAGKTSIIEAITFALFNKSFRKINRPQLVNSINGKHCVVTITFDIGSDNYVVSRGIKPDIFTIHKNGKIIEQEAASRDHQRYLEQVILKMNFKSFTQVVVLGSSNFVPFMELQAADRRSVVESILDIAVFSQMNNLLKGRVTSWKDRDVAVDAEVKTLAESYRIKQDFINKMKTNIDAEKLKRAERKESLMKSILEIREKLLGINEKIESSQEELTRPIKEKLDETKERKSQLTFKKKELSSQVEFFTKSESCPMCRQNISHEHKEANLNLLKLEADSIVVELTTVEREVSELASAMNSQTQLSRNVAAWNSEVKLLKANAVNLANQIRELDAEVNPQENDVREEEDYLNILTGQLLTLKQTKKDLADEREVLEIAQLLLKDSGIKKTIIKQYVPIINKLVNKYLQMMNFFVKFEIDEEFNETIKSKSKEEFSYRSFSMGERSRIDLALLFTWREVAKMKNSLSTNLLFFDEVFDSSLDGAGADDLMTILASLGENVNTFIISHKGDAIADKVRSSIHFEKVKGFSKITTP